MSGLKYSAGTETPINTFRLEDFLYTNNPGGPTNVSGYYNTRPVPTNGYVIYIDKASGGPSTYVAQDDTELITLSNIISNQTFTTIEECISYFQNQSNMVVLNGNSPDIILDGLVFYLDGGVLQSYPKTGTTWYDLSYSGNNGTLINSPSFSGSNYGSIVFDGVDDYILMPSTGITVGGYFDPWTVSFWVNKNSPLDYVSNNLTFLGNNTSTVSGGYADQSVVSFNVNTITTDLSGKTYVGGFFLGYSGIPSSKIVRLNSDGSYDTTFNTGGGFNRSSSVTKILLSSSGKIYVGGNFNEYSGITTNGLVRLNYDGTIDTTFSAGTGFNSTVNDIVEDSNGNIYVGGVFNAYKSITNNNKIIKLDSFGNKITSFNNSTGFRFGTSTSTTYGVLTLSLSQDETKLYCGGNFTTYKSSTVNTNRLARLNTSDGSLDTTFDMTIGFDNNVRKVLSSPNGVYVGGDFLNALNTSANRFIRLTTGGTIDNTFQIGTGFNSIVYNIAEDQNNKVYVGGAFSVYSGQTNRDIIRLNSDGFKDTLFDNNPGTNLSVYAVHYNGSDLYIGGDFTTYDGLSALRVAKVNIDGTIDTSFDTSEGVDSGAWRQRVLYYFVTSAGLVDDTNVYFPTTNYYTYDELSSINYNKWVYYTLTMSSGGLLSVFNNTERMTTQSLSTALKRDLSFSKIGINVVSSSPFKGNISSISIYNRELSSGETVQNFSRTVSIFSEPLLLDFKQRVLNDSGTTITINNADFYKEYYKLISPSPSVLTFPYSYKTSKLYSLIPQSGTSDFTFSRNGSATYFNENGVLTTIGNNLPRLNYDPLTKVYEGPLIEPSSVNYFLQTLSFSSPWIFSSTQQVTDDLFLLNSGKNMKVLVNDSINSSANSLCIRQSQTNIIKQGYNSLSFFVKKTTNHNSIGVWGYTTGASYNVSFNVDTLTVSRPITSAVFTSRVGGVIPIGNDIFYCYESFSASTNLTPSMGFSPTSSGSNSMVAGQEISIAGIQMENRQFPTTFIPTSGSTVTRPEDIISSPLLNYNTSAYTIFFDIEYLYDYVANTGDVSADPLIWYFRRLSTTQVNFWNQNNQQTLGTFSFSPANSVKRFKCILKFDGQRITTYVNGTRTGNSITPTSVIPYQNYLSSNLYKLRASKVNLTGSFDGSHVLKSFAIYPEYLSDEMSVYLTTIF
jgi:uncharacterized delta-60 repeat protein